MKLLSETKAVEILHRIKSDFQSHIAEKYEHRAKNCHSCETPGACCLDAHFVNVHISRLEAAAIRNTVRKLSDQQQKAMAQRVRQRDHKRLLGLLPYLERCGGALRDERRIRQWTELD